MRLTEAQINAARSPAGGWTRETLEGWGVPWPPPKGWKAELTGKSLKRQRAGNWTCSEGHPMKHPNLIWTSAPLDPSERPKSQAELRTGKRWTAQCAICEGVREC